MFEIGFSELVLVLIVGLLVLGPQRLPVAIRTVIKWVRTIRGLVANVQNELSQELKLQELQESIKKAENLNLQSLSPELAQTVDELKQSAQKMKADLESQAQATNQTLQQQIEGVRNANFETSQNLAQNSEQSAVENSTQNLTALETTENALSPAELAEQAELELDEKLAKYIDQYHPEDGLQPITTDSKSENS